MNMSPRITSQDIIEAFHRIAQIMIDAAEAEGDELARLDEEALDLLEKLGDAPEEKLERLRAVSLHLDAQAKMLRDEEKRLATRRRALESGVSAVRRYAGDILKARREAGYEPRIKTPSHSFWLAMTTSLVGPEHVSAWREQGWTRPEEKPDKTAATKALKGGAEADGFRLAASESVRWR